MPQAKTEVALQFLKCCAAEVALQHWLFCSADVILTKSCTAASEKLQCNIEKAALQESGAFLPLSCGFQAPLVVHSWAHSWVHLWGLASVSPALRSPVSLNISSLKNLPGEEVRKRFNRSLVRTGVWRGFCNGPRTLKTAGRKKAWKRALPSLKAWKRAISFSAPNSGMQQALVQKRSGKRAFEVGGNARHSSH